LFFYRLLITGTQIEYPDYTIVFPAPAGITFIGGINDFAIAVTELLINRNIPEAYPALPILILQIKSGSFPVTGFQIDQ